MTDFEFYETPGTFTRWLFMQMFDLGVPITGRLLEPCVGSRAIPAAVEAMAATGLGAPWRGLTWVTNDLDDRWPADYHGDAAAPALWKLLGEIDWTISNPPFTPAIDIIERALAMSRIGVAMHLRASIHEVLKTGVRRTWMADHTPTGLLWLPRFGYQRSRTTGKWTTDSVCACWCIWLREPKPHQQFLRYAPEAILDALDAETPVYRRRMDRLMADYVKGDTITGLTSTAVKDFWS